MKLPEVTEIRRMRKALDMTQAQLCHLSGVPQSTIAKVESGSINGSYETVRRLFEALPTKQPFPSLYTRNEELLHALVINAAAVMPMKNHVFIFSPSCY